VKSLNQLENKKVLVVGGAKSAFDLAHAAAIYGKSSTLLARNMGWAFPDKGGHK
jgi:cation diffusion facilitator CzcD-associated flavoprotein CzcO